jgi:hypothetical protein
LSSSAAGNWETSGRYDDDTTVPAPGPIGPSTAWSCAKLKAAERTHDPAVAGSAGQRQRRPDLSPRPGRHAELGLFQ